MNIVPTNSPSVFAPLNTLVLEKSQYAIVRPDNPPPGVAGFLFSLVDDDKVELESEITDHYTETNNPVQDHIALKPEIVTVTGDVAEVVLAPNTSAQKSALTNPLPRIPGLMPELAPQAQKNQTATEATQASVSAEVGKAGSLFGYYQSRTPELSGSTKQQVAFGFFYQLWKGRQLCSVETPWGFFTDMAVQSVSAHQGATTRVVSDFTLTFKKIRRALSITTNPDYWAGRAMDQRVLLTQNGVVGQIGLTPAQEGQYLQSLKPAQ